MSDLSPPARSRPLGEILDLLDSLTDRHEANAPMLVCIDGMGGAGKSELARRLCKERQDLSVVSGDEFYGPEERDWAQWTPEQGYARYFDHVRLEHEVLRPLRSGRPARYQRYDWSTRRLDGWVTIDPAGIVLVEGVYVLRRRLRQYWDASIYVDTPRHERRRRLYARGENDDGWIDRWMAAEDYYLEVDDPRSAATLVVRGG